MKPQVACNSFMLDRWFQYIISKVGHLYFSQASSTQLRIPFGLGLLGTVAQTGKLIKIENIAEVDTNNRLK